MKKLFLLLSMSTAAVAAAPSISSAKLVLDLPPILAGKTSSGCTVDSECGTGYCCNSKCQQNQCVIASGLLNDTGITWSGTGVTGNNTGTTCSDAAQDCSYGWDKTDVSNAADGHAGFKFTKLDSGGGVATGANFECVRDERTGLIWEVKSSSSASWSVAKTNAASFTACNVSAGNWRLPTVKELLSIVSYYDIIPSPAITPGPAIDTVYFPTNASSYWTVTELSSETSKAWAVNFVDGSTKQLSKTEPYRFRLVYKAAP